MIICPLPSLRTPPLPCTSLPISPVPSPLLRIISLTYPAQIGTEGASIGQSQQNTVSIPSDSMLAPLNHAIVKYQEARSQKVGGESGAGEGVRIGDDSVAGGSDGVSTPGSSEDGSGGVGGFFFADGGQDTDFPAALRIRVGEGNRDWPLTEVRLIGSCCTLPQSRERYSWVRVSSNVHASSMWCSIVCK